MVKGTEEPTVAACEALFVVVDVNQHELRQVLEDLEDLEAKGHVLPAEGAELHTAIRVALAAYLPGRS